MKKVWFLGALASTMALCSSSFAESFFEANPANWRLQNYIPNTVVAFYTPSSCLSGAVSFPASATSDDKNRFFSMILTAKATGKFVGIYYETVTGSCLMSTFYTATGTDTVILNGTASSTLARPAAAK